MERSFTMWFWGLKSANVCPCAYRKRRLIMGYKLSYITGLLYTCVFLHAVSRMRLGSWTLGYPGSGNILFQKRMSYFSKEPTAFPREDPELQPQS